MMNIDPPNAWEWILLLLVGALAGGVNALRSYAQKGTTQALVVGVVESSRLRGPRPRSIQPVNTRPKSKSTSTAARRQFMT